MSIFNGKTAVEKNDGETASTVSGATANTKVTTQKAIDVQRLAKDKSTTSRVGGSGKPAVGFKLEDEENRGSPD